MFIDIHAHAYLEPWPWLNEGPAFCTPEQLLEKYDRLGIERACLLPIVSSEVYLPQSNEEILQMARRYPDRFIPFCNIDPRAFSNTADAPLDFYLKYYRDKGCKGIGELMPHMPFNHPMVQNLFKHVAAVGLPVIFDGSAQPMDSGVPYKYGLYDDPGLPQLEQTLLRFPDLIILGHGPTFWSEIGRLETPFDRSFYPKYPIREEGVVPRLFRRYPNLYGDMSAGSGYNAMSRDPEYAVKFLNEFQDRLLFGTDICRPSQNDVPIIDFLKNLQKTGKITEAVLKKIARENAIKLFNI